MLRTLISLVCLSLLAGTSLLAAEIHEVARTGDIERLQSIITANPDQISAADEGGSLPLHIASLNGHLEAVKLLIASGADVGAGDGDNSSALNCAASRGHLDIVKFLVAKGATVEERDTHNATPFLVSGWGGNLDVARFLLDNGAFMNVRDNLGNTPLLASAWSGNRDFVEFLLDKGSDINEKTNFGTTALHRAASGGHEELVRFLAERGADLNAKNGAGMTPLASAVHSGRPGTVRLLIEAGADINVLDNDGNSPLAHSAFRWVPIDVMRMLIEHGAPLDAASDSCTGPIEWAVGAGTVEQLQLLIESGANVNADLGEGETALNKATRQGKEDKAAVLLEAHAEVNRQDSRYGRAPLHWCAIKGMSRVVELLLASGANVDAPDNAGHSPLYFAARYGHKTVADLLKAGGANPSGIEEDYDPPAMLGQGVGEKEAAVWYLGCSGWGIKTENHFLIFDYFERAVKPDQPGLANGRIDPDEIKDLNVVVFSSHEHGDHFDTTIFGWREQIPNITYVLGHHPEGRSGYEYIPPRTDRTIDDLRIWTITATDAGVGFLVEVDGLVIFHAGDHANGQTEGIQATFSDEIDFLAGTGKTPDLAFLPVLGCSLGTPESVRAGNYYVLDKLSPRVFFPQHGMTSTYLFRESADQARKDGYSLPMPCAENSGDCFHYKNGYML
ncbi:MAG: ankyrin repeat domain-containing protein [Candidatus Zixiibacteriota bacterium]|nr:MAG: ankyrin repeat domain-containing protein [candidate division Zixibacteria bacterium]